MPMVLLKMFKKTVQLFSLWKADKKEHRKPCVNHFETGFWPYEVSFLLDETLLKNCGSNDIESSQRESIK